MKLTIRNFRKMFLQAHEKHANDVKEVIRTNNIRNPNEFYKIKQINEEQTKFTITAKKSFKELFKTIAAELDELDDIEFNQETSKLTIEFSKTIRLATLKDTINICSILLIQEAIRDQLQDDEDEDEDENENTDDETNNENHTADTSENNPFADSTPTGLHALKHACAVTNSLFSSGAMAIVAHNQSAPAIATSGIFSVLGFSLKQTHDALENQISRNRIQAKEKFFKDHQETDTRTLIRPKGFLHKRPLGLAKPISDWRFWITTLLQVFLQVATLASFGSYAAYSNDDDSNREKSDSFNALSVYLIVISMVLDQVIQYIKENNLDSYEETVNKKIFKPG